MNILILSFLTNLNFLSFFLSSPLSPYYFNTFKINQTKKFKKKKKRTWHECKFQCYFLLLFTPLWSCCCHRNDNPCWDSVASSLHIWMLNPLAKHHSQSELAMINNPTREIWLGETKAWGSEGMSNSNVAVIGPQSDWKSHTEKTWNARLQWVVSAVFLNHGLGPKIGYLVGCN